MARRRRRQVSTAYLVLILFLSSFILIQLFIRANDIHAVDPYVDRLLRSTIALMILLVSLFGIVAARAVALREWVRILSSFSLYVLVLPFLWFTFESCSMISEAEYNATNQMVLETRDGWTYFAHTSRRSALDEVAPFIRKERPLSTQFVMRRFVDSTESEALGLNLDSIHAAYTDFYLQHYHSR